MKQISPDWLSKPEVKKIFDVFATAGFDLYAVGGCVRNAVLKEPVNDLDFSTNARPKEIQKIAKDAGLRSIPTGIDHGTITVIVQGQTFEITTFRKDVETDGRRAVVAFSDDIQDDAQRRDFTMNALYLDRDGTILDPVLGLPDTLDRHLRFIGSAEDRIKEDYLRILRFFRFWAWYGDPNSGIDPDGLSACAKYAEGLSNISKERIGQEVFKLLGAPNPVPSVASMDQSGILAQVLPGASTRALGPFVHLEATVDPTARLASMGDFDLSPLRLSNAIQKRDAVLRDTAVGTQSPFEIGFLHGQKDGSLILGLRAALLEMPLNTADNLQMLKGANAEFPLRPSDLMPKFEGPELGKALKTARQKWIRAEGDLTKAQILADL